ncbi:MAG TPA: CBS domain-containing protein [Saprospiraceae bacterium]|nr:CBS domain-containing protein [Saprospiraceae bacterium]
MATKLITFTPDADIREAIDVLLKKKISGAPVVDDKGKLIGMLSEVDCLRILLDGPYNKEPAKTLVCVRDYMSGDVTTISSEKTILDAAFLFVNSGLKRLPVLENGELIGQISRVDVLHAVAKMKPGIKHVPDSWKGREPAMPDHKKTHHSENA